MSIQLPLVCQMSETHCGPAVLKMLLSYQNCHFSQEQITDAAGVTGVILDKGTRPYQLAQAVEVLAPQHIFWFKQHAIVSDLEQLLHVHRHPVGINFQDLFYDSVDEESEAHPKKNIYGDFGHYSVAIDIDIDKDLITIADPYPDFCKSPRVFSLKWFETRWWDYAKDYNAGTGLYDVIRPHHFIFIVAPRDAAFPQELGMQTADRLSDLIKK